MLEIGPMIPTVARASCAASVRALRAISSVGRAPRSHRGGHGIEARIAHCVSLAACLHVAIGLAAQSLVLWPIAFWSTD